MSKRSGEPLDEAQQAMKSGQRPQKHIEQDDIGEFQDEFEDEFESDEDEVFEAGADGNPDEEADTRDARGMQETRARILRLLIQHLLDVMQMDQQTFIPGRTALSAGESLSPDPSTYQMLHTLSAPWPCLSFDLLDDPLSTNPLSYPLTLYAVAGTQAEVGKENENELMVMKLSGLSRMENDEDSSEAEDDDDHEDSEPILESKSIPLSSTTNRIRAFQSPPISSATSPVTLAAAMLESGNVQIHDLTPHIASFNTPGTILSSGQSNPMSTLRMHKGIEGYALDWAPASTDPLGKLLTGDNNGQIFVTTRAEGGGWATDSRPFTGHTGSIEEIQWSPSERNVFSTASSDGTVKIWDARSKSRTAQLTVQVSETDINVMSWSRQTTHLLAAGDDAGAWTVWDLRTWKPSTSATGSTNGATTASVTSTPIASFSFHKSPVTSIEWHPTDDSIILVGCADNTVSLWDLAVELDDEESRDTQGIQDVPPQLLFVHFMDNIKEAHWCRQHPGTVMATGGGGFRQVNFQSPSHTLTSTNSVFKTISV
jgi:ribosome assembly protein RRB1